MSTLGMTLIVGGVEPMVDRSTGAVRVDRESGRPLFTVHVMAVSAGDAKPEQWPVRVCGEPVGFGVGTAPPGQRQGEEAVVGIREGQAPGQQHRRRPVDDVQDLPPGARQPRHHADQHPTAQNGRCSSHYTSRTSRPSILGDGMHTMGAAADRIPAGLPGVGYITVEGIREPQRVRAAWVTDQQILTAGGDHPAPAGTAHRPSRAAGHDHRTGRVMNGQPSAPTAGVDPARFPGLRPAAELSRRQDVTGPAAPAASNKVVELWSVCEAGAVMGVSAQSLSRWRKGGIGPAYLRLGRKVRYRSGDVTAWIDGQVQHPIAAF
ncbi:MAG: helix-turn-helix domain-containing protein [Geodermatophilaceae bacterium]|nr:helix-turn-helix domain-containing protein [Geodermatophilaceae bacterium]